MCCPLPSCPSSGLSCCLECSFYPPKMSLGLPTFFLCLSCTRFILGVQPFTMEHISLEHGLLQERALPYKTTLYILFSLKFFSISGSLLLSSSLFLCPHSHPASLHFSWHSFSFALLGCYRYFQCASFLSVITLAHLSL